MPGKGHKKPQAEAVTDSVAFAEGTGPFHFGDTLTVVATTSDATPQGYVTVQAYLNGEPSGGQGTYVALYEVNGIWPNPTLVLGPTPTWDNDGGHPWDSATGSLSLVSWRDYGLTGGPDKAEFITLAGPVPFDVLP